MAEECGCEVGWDRPQLYVKHCPMHAQAKNMLAALLAAPDPPPPNTAWEEQYVVWHCMSRKPVVAAQGGEA